MVQGNGHQTQDRWEALCISQINKRGSSENQLWRCEYCDALLGLGRKTPFPVRNIKNHEEMTFLDLEDPEGNDVASMMVELGCAAADKLSGNTQNSLYTQYL